MAVNGVMAQPLADPVGGGLSKRIGSALVLAPLALLVVYAGPPYFIGLVLLAAIVMTFEWVRLCSGGGSIALLVGIGLCVCAAVALASLGEMGWAIITVAASAAAVWLLVAAIVDGRLAVWMAAGVVYIALPCVALVWLRGDGEAGRSAVFWLLAVVWGMDIGAFAVGKALGGPKLAPRISPKKTWSGLIGGAICSALAGTAVALVLNGDMSHTVWLAAGAAVLGILSQGGDLLESAVKRHFGAKDAGNIIPGHGGVLDRVDGLLAASVAMAAYGLATGGGAAS
jgi:phosphatidate cytidylyltransferase